MQPKNRRVAVLFASVFAVVAIVLAGVARYMETPTEETTSAEVAVSAGSPTARGAELPAVDQAVWQGALQEATAAKQVGSSVTDALIAGLGTNYETLTDESTPAAKKKEIITDIVKGAVPETKPARVYARADLSVSTTTDYVGYSTILALVLRQASEVREYELATFLRAIQNGNRSGSPELIEDATIYTRIQSALVAMAVPETLASEHLALVNSLGALAQAVTAMGKWNGDPSLGLVYIGDFKEAEAAMRESMYALTNKLEKLS